MSVTEVLNGLGSWQLSLGDTLPDEVARQLDYFGHVAIIDGRVDVEATGDGLLSAARYVGVLRRRDLDETRTIGGESMELWLGDEDDKGQVIESALNLGGMSITAALNAVLPDAIHLGTVHDPGGTMPSPSKVQWFSPRKAVALICDTFGVEYRVNGNGTLDVGTPAQLYLTVPRSGDVDPLIVRHGSGSDIDVAALGGSPAVSGDAGDYSSRIVLVGSTLDDGTFAVGSQSAPTVPYKDLFGNTVKRTRLISETGQETGSVGARAQLQLNRYNRTKTALKVTAYDYEIAGSFRVGDEVWIHDPESGLVNAANEVIFRGELLHPDKIRVSGLTWAVVEGMTVAFRTASGVWVDLTSFVTYETASSNEVTVGDLPRSLTSGASNPVIDRQDSAPDRVAPGAPTGLNLTTTSILNGRGGNAAVITATWTAPAVNADDTSIGDLSYYVVQWRVTGRPQWQTTYSSSPTVDLQAQIDLDYDVRVAAADKSGNVGSFTGTSTIHTAVDTTAPPAPADPVVTSYLGQLRIEYPGTDYTGAPMPKDANLVGVYVSSTSGFTPSDTNRVSWLDPRTRGVAYATAPYGSTRYVKLVAFDNAGNASTPSGQVSGSTVQVADGDIASLNVGKLVAGTISVDVLISGQIATALSGQRMALNSIGLQGWNASNQKTVDINGVSNLLTGTFQTALSGRRIILGASGTTGEIDFYAPDGTQSLLRAFTEASGVESIQFGVPDPTNSGASKDMLWNRVHVNSDQWTNIRANKLDFYFGKANGYFIVRHTTDKGQTAQGRFQVNGTSINMWDGAGTNRLQLDNNGFVLWDTDGSTRINVSTTQTVFYDSVGTGRMQIVGSTNSDARIYYYMPSPAGAGTTNPGYMTLKAGIVSDSSPSLTLSNGLGYGGGMNYLQSINNIQIVDVSTNNYIGVAASAFNVYSDGRAKRQIADWSASATDLLRPVRVRQYERILPDGSPGMPARTEVGLVAQELAAAAGQLVVSDDPDHLLVDVYGLVASVLKYAQEIDSRLLLLEKGRQP